MVLLPAALMVSTIRFRSFKTFDLQSRRPYTVVLLIAAGIALIAVEPSVVLVVLAYAYLASAFIGMAITRVRHRGERPGQAASPHAVAIDPPARDAERSIEAQRRLLVTWLRCRGSVSVTVVPAPRSLATRIVPPFSSTFRFAIVSPSPVPVAFVEKYG